MPLNTVTQNQDCNACDLHSESTWLEFQYRQYGLLGCAAVSPGWLFWNVQTHLQEVSLKYRILRITEWTSWYSILRRILVGNLFKFVLDYTVNLHISDDELQVGREFDPIFSSIWYSSLHLQLIQEPITKLPTSAQWNFVEYSTLIFCNCTSLSSLPSIIWLFSGLPHLTLHRLVSTNMASIAL
jgi:hypothetical protein